jgi:formylglycine-generating enzyme
MKSRFFILAVIIILLNFSFACRKRSPPTIDAINSPTNTLTITFTITSTFTVTGTPNATQTEIALQTAIVSFVFVPGGTFTQYDTVGNSFSHIITSYYIGEHEVTYELWYTVYQWAVVNGYAFANQGTEGCCGATGLAPTAAKYQPVTYINWRDMIVWCNAYSQKEGLVPVYCSDALMTTAIKDSTDGAFGSTIDATAGSYDNPYANWSSTGFRLPTEGEWQYAASYIDGSSWTSYNYASGATAAYFDATATGLVAWYLSNSGNVTHIVGTKNPNALGIYDMSGNVWEWCWDWYGAYPGASTDYRGPISGTDRVIRGGSFNHGAGAASTRVGNRGATYTYDKSYSYGFRLVRTY